MPDIIRCSYSVEVRERAAPADGAADDRTVDVIASTDEVDAFGDVVVQDFDLARYVRNPVVFWGHESWGKPIGFSDPVSVEDGKLKATLHFVDERANPEGEQVLQGFRQKSIRAVSIGFRPGKVTPGQIDGRDVFFLSANELVEISAVGIPANPGAIAEEREKRLTWLREKSITAPLGASTPKETDMTTPLKTVSLLPVLAVLCLAESAGETEVLSSIKSLQDENEKLRASRDALLELTGKSAAPEAIGVVRGWKQGAEGQGTLTARVDELTKGIEARDRSDIIKSLRAAGKIAPASIAWAEKTPLAELKSFAETAPVIPQFAQNDETPPLASGPLTTPAGEKFADLAPMQKAALYRSNRPLYDAMKADHERRSTT